MLHTCKAEIVANKASRVVHNGADHVVIPVVMIVEGVLNNSLLLREEFGRFVEGWNGRPVPVYHPEENGQPISANRPDVVDKSVIGYIYNARVDGDKLVGEIWADPAKAERVGRSEMLAALEAGAMMEVSTGYFSALEDTRGDHNGKPYLNIARNIVPDHLALLPTQEGACSLNDGCGTRPTIMQRIAAAFGLRTNQSGEPAMCNKTQRVNKLAANAELTPEQLQSLIDMDEEQLAMLEAVAGALKSPPAPAAQEEKPAAVDPEEVAKLAVNMLRRETQVDRLVANSSCVLDRPTLSAMSQEQLDKYEASIRPVDYSGAGGAFVQNQSADTAEFVPVPAGILGGTK